MVWSHLEQFKNMVRVYPLEDTEFVRAASIYHCFFLLHVLLSAHVSFLTKESGRTPLLVSRQSLDSLSSLPC